MALRFLLLPQLKFLKKEGYEVCAICSKGKFIKDIIKEGISVKIVNFKRGVSPLFHTVSLVKLIFYFRKRNFDIVHTHNPAPGLLGQVAAKVSGVPIIINTIHGFYFDENTPFLKRKFFVYAEKIAASCSTLIFSQNKEDIKTALKEKICPDGKIKYLGNGINLSVFSPQKLSGDFVANKKKELGIPDCVYVIGIVGRLVAEKGYLDLFEAVKSVIKEIPNILLLAVGPEEPTKIDRIDKDIVKKYGIESNTLFLGERTDLDEIYPLMDLFVLPSHREGFPRSVIEALAMRRPVIVTNIRGCREIVEDEKNGILVPMKNSKALADKMIYMLQNRKERERMSENGRKKAEQEFDEKLVFDRIKECYQMTVKK